MNSVLNWLLLQVSSAVFCVVVGLLLGNLLQKSSAKVRQRGKRAAWKNFVEGMCFILPQYSHDYSMMGGVAAVTDAMAYAELRAHLESLGVSRGKIRLSFTGTQRPSLQDNLIIIGGGSANSVARIFLDKIETSLKQEVDAQSPRSYKVSTIDNQEKKSYHVTPDFEPEKEDDVPVTDYAIIVRAENPYCRGKSVLLITGMTGYGTWGATRLLCDEILMQHPIWRSGKDLECLVKITATYQQPQAQEIVVIRELLTMLPIVENGL